MFVFCPVVELHCNCGNITVRWVRDAPSEPPDFIQGMPDCSVHCWARACRPYEYNF